MVKTISNFVSDIESLSVLKELPEALLIQKTPYFNSSIYLPNYKNNNNLSLKFPGPVCM